MKSAIATIAAALLSSPASAAQLVWPSKFDEIEDLNVLHGGVKRGFSDSLNPCTFGNNVKGRQNSAQWIRAAFHDMATHDKEAGTGGIDGSIFYELARAENKGDAFLNTYSFFSGYHTVRTPVSDLLALGVITAAGACRGPKIPLRAGRVDATVAGPAGVPEAHTNLEETTKTFEKAGFNKEDMIAMVACGHTLGGVHSVDHPEIVEIPEDPNNDTLVLFQKDVSIMHNGVVTEYLDGTTKNPLVVANNNTLNSDKRIFESDGNKTMNSLADKDKFASKCADILGRMIDTVPASVTLSDVIDHYDVKPYVEELSLNDKDELRFKGQIRLDVSKGTGRETGDTTINLVYADRNGEGKTSIPTTLFTLKGGKSYGLHNEEFSYFLFDATVDAARGISKFWVEETSKDGKKTTHDNLGTGGYPVDDTVLYQFPESCMDTNNVIDKKMAVVVTALVLEDRASDPLTLEMIHKVAQENVPVYDLQKEVVDFKPTGVKRAGRVALRAQTKVTGFTTFDIVLGGKQRSAIEYQKTIAMGSTCPK